ncbi:DUF4265 domain-containing protein [Micromonospora sp. NBC_01796]|uniref:DUF4265 domain-containing protein n=1 Tax=Micromonospora sp. NBC_01796 TaxID=2975987 RepID=UPI002DD983E8|nr:DUF4265 domain-containing protein [Micromonospora sp. NBC_01796]WSA83237.1 DUF4265 domain-containing protein [Micromonospora sp. NBC_01796]
MSATAPDRSRPSEDEYVKIWFRFVPREGWLPYDTEGLWAMAVGADTARISNVPFLQDGVAEGDLVRFEADPAGLRWATGRVESSGNCTVRILPIPDGPLGRSAQAVHDLVAPLGLGGEVFSEELPLVALTVPAGADLPRIKAFLIEGEAKGWWHFEEACTTEAWEVA